MKNRYIYNIIILIIIIIYNYNYILYIYKSLKFIMCGLNCIVASLILHTWYYACMFKMQY